MTEDQKLALLEADMRVLRAKLNRLEWELTRRLAAARAAIQAAQAQHPHH